jgi:HSP20 family molecular chaperone IbpA
VTPLPAEVTADDAKAGYKDGVLRISVPRRNYVVQKQIKIKVTGE